MPWQLVIFGITVDCEKPCARDVYALGEYYSDRVVSLQNSFGLLYM
jgi:hypothetical protein